MPRYDYSNENRYVYHHYNVLTQCRVIDPFVKGQGLPSMFAGHIGRGNHF